jgi:hypothetical protein
MSRTVFWSILIMNNALWIYGHSLASDDLLRFMCAVFALIFTVAIIAFYEMNKGG